MPRPEIVPKYCFCSNEIDLHNQSRQFHLRLEKHWITEDGCFRVIAAMFGITITDAWKGHTHHLHVRHHHKETELLGFARLVAKDMLNNKFSKTSSKQKLEIGVTTGHHTAKTLIMTIPTTTMLLPHPTLHQLQSTMPL